MLSEANAQSSALLTDLYQLTMLQGYFDQRMEETAVFEFFVRKLPAQRNFLIAAGLEQALSFLEDVHLTSAELEWIARHGAFRPDFVRYLEKLRFTGTVHAVPEGTVFFPNEPILRVTAPIAQAHEHEETAFDHFAHSLPENVILLIDTYDTEAAAKKVVRLAPKLARDGIKIKGVRLDSGDLADHAFKVRRILDEGGLKDATIFASGSVDEYVLERLMRQNAPIDGFGIGTHMDTSADAPYLDCAYKLVEYGGKARRKRSEGKVLWPGCKQVFRRYDNDGKMRGDVLSLEGDSMVGEPLIRSMMENGRRLTPPEPLEQSRRHALDELGRLPGALRQLERGPDYPVVVSEALKNLAREVDIIQSQDNER